MELRDGTVRLIDQRRLPAAEVYLELKDYRQVALAIRDLAVRGAPVIGVTAACGLALEARRLAQEAPPPPPREALERLGLAAEELGATRPTAVNLFWAIDRVLEAARRAAAGAPRGLPPAENIARAVEEQALALAREDVDINRRLGRYGQELIRDGDGVLTHCNAGSLATVDYGTAVGVIRAAHEGGKRVHVYVDETRPVLQGARLTAWEMVKAGIPATLITDNMAASLMRRGLIQVVVVGADRVARNGDFANKIGTYGVAVLAREHGIPFYAAVPTPTIDLSLASGQDIPIEERDPSEVTHLAGVRIAPEGIEVANPAFDVTPHRYVTGIITEKGVVHPPFDATLLRLFEGGIPIAPELSPGHDHQGKE